MPPGPWPSRETRCPRLLGHAVVLKEPYGRADRFVSGFIGVVVVLVLVVLFGWLAIRAWHVRNMALRIVGGLLTSLLTLVFAAVSVVGLVGVYRLYAPHGQPAANITVRAATAS